MMKVIIFIILSILIAIIPLNILRMAMADPSFGWFGGKAAYLRLSFTLGIAVLLIYGLYNLMF